MSQRPDTVVPNSPIWCRSQATIAALAVLVFALGLEACATVAPSTESVTVNESDDLGEAFHRARELAAELGREKVLLAFDLDNTLLAMNTDLGADHWYEWQKRLEESDPCDIRLVGDRLAVQGALYHLGSMRPTQDDLPELIGRARESGQPVMIITSRGSAFRLSTFRELRRNGLSFRDTAPGRLGGYLSNLGLEGASRAIRYEDGVLMLAGQDKGEIGFRRFRR